MARLTLRPINDCILQAERRNPLHAKVRQQAEQSRITEADALQQLLSGAPLSEGEAGSNAADGEEAAYRRWCADRVAAGELQLLWRAQSVVDDLTAQVDDESSDPEDGNDSTDDEL